MTTSAPQPLPPHSDPKVLAEISERFDALVQEACELWIGETTERIGLTSFDPIDSKIVADNARGTLFGVMLAGMLMSGTKVEDLHRLVDKAHALHAESLSDTTPPEAPADPVV